MRKTEMKRFKSLLENMRRQVIGQMNQLERDNISKSQRESSGDLSSYAYHMADLASDSFEREFEMSIASHGSETLQEIEDALERIEDGSYGKCEDCSKQIGARRLEAVPHARLCIECKSKAEKERGVS